MFLIAFLGGIYGKKNGLTMTVNFINPFSPALCSSLPHFITLSDPIGLQCSKKCLLYDIDFFFSIKKKSKGKSTHLAPARVFKTFQIII